MLGLYDNQGPLRHRKQKLQEMMMSVLGVLILGQLNPRCDDITEASTGLSC